MSITVSGVLFVGDLSGRTDIGLCDLVSPSPEGIERNERQQPPYWSVGWTFLRAELETKWTGIAQRLDPATAWLASQSPDTFAQIQEARADTYICFSVLGTQGDEAHFRLPPGFIRACADLGLPISWAFTCADKMQGK